MATDVPRDFFRFFLTGNGLSLSSSTEGDVGERNSGDPYGVELNVLSDKVKSARSDW